MVGMTAMPEARLAREAGLCYAMLAMVTDYDVWHESEAPVTVEMVQRVLHDNVDAGREPPSPAWPRPVSPYALAAAATHSTARSSPARTVDPMRRNSLFDAASPGSRSGRRPAGE